MRYSSSPLRLLFRSKTFHAVLALVLGFTGEVTSEDLTAAKDQPANRIVKEQPATEPFVKTPLGYMIPYTARIPGTEITFEMVPVPGAKPAPRDDGEDFETVQPFWIGKYEVTWQEYAEYMKLHHVFKKLKYTKQRIVDDSNRVDAVTAPSQVYEVYVRFEFATGPKTPASTMSRYAARQYTKWLSKTSGHQYRLPTEIEWEHACRAGTSTPWSFGADSSVAGDFCVFEGNAGDDGPRIVGSRKPNPWGIHDMHGNVAEWVLSKDLVKDHRTFRGKPGPSTDAYQQTFRVMVLKGGNWEQDVEACRSDARRLGSVDLWEEDPYIPHSPWWLANTEATGIGFRIISPLEDYSPDEIEAYWGPDTNELTADINTRTEDGHGVLGLVDRELPGVVLRLYEPKGKYGERPPWKYNEPATPASRREP